MVTLSLIVLSAGLLVLIFPAPEVPYLAWVALAPLLFIITHARPRGAFLSALAVGALFACGLDWWMLRINGMGLGNFSLGVAGNAFYIGLFGLAAQYFHARLPRWDIVTFPTIWVLLEYLKTHTDFLSFPWGILGYSQYAVLPVAQVSALTGVYGVSFLIVAVNALVVDILPVLVPLSNWQDLWGRLARRGRMLSWRLVVIGVVLVAALFPYGLFAFREEAPWPTVTVAVVQGKVSVKDWTHARSKDALFQRYAGLSLRAAESQPALIIWPSSSLPARIPAEQYWVNRVLRLAQRADSFLLTGSTGFDKLTPNKKPGFANSAFLFSPRGRIVGRYDKIGLLPFDEYIPLREYIAWPDWLVSDHRDYQRGEELTTFRMDGVRFGVQICWENMFADQFRELAGRDLDFMVSMTNEAFTDVPASHYQMLAINVFRAIENHVAIVRASTTGVSGIIAPHGRILARVQDDSAQVLNIDGYVVGQVPLSSDRTLYTRYGDWFIWLLVLLLSGLAAFALYRDLRHHGRPPTS